MNQTSIDPIEFGTDPYELTPEWRSEAIFRLFQNLAIASKESGTKIKNCWVPTDSFDEETNQIIEEKNTYKKIRIGEKSFSAHVIVLTLIHNRRPIRNQGKETREVGMHMCNNPACRNPLHLKFGTSKMDSEYKVACGRAPAGPLNGHSTKPERTPRGENHYNSRLTGEKLETALKLIKKYGDRSGYAPAIAAHLQSTAYTIHNLKRKKLHLGPNIGPTDIELNFGPRPGKNQNVRRDPERKKEMIISIRQRFHRATIVERSGLLMQFEREYGISNVTVRNILKQKTHPELTPDTPIPTEWGSGRRKSFKHSKFLEQQQVMTFNLQDTEEK